MFYCDDLKNCAIHGGKPIFAVIGVAETEGLPVGNIWLTAKEDAVAPLRQKLTDEMGRMFNDPKEPLKISHHVVRFGVG